MAQDEILRLWRVRFRCQSTSQTTFLGGNLAESWPSAGPSPRVYLVMFVTNYDGKRLLDSAVSNIAQLHTEVENIEMKMRKCKT